MDGTWRSVLARLGGRACGEMSVGGSTLMCVTRPTGTARATDGYRYGAVPLAREGTAAREAGPEAAVSRRLALVASAAPELAGQQQAELDFAAVEFGEIEFAVIDLETTGWSPRAAAITEVAAVRVRGGRRQGEFASLVNPGVPVPPGIEDLTGISDWMLAAAPGVAAVLPGLLRFAEGCI